MRTVTIVQVVNTKWVVMQIQLGGVLAARPALADGTLPRDAPPLQTLCALHVQLALVIRTSTAVGAIRRAVVLPALPVVQGSTTTVVELAQGPVQTVPAESTAPAII